MVKTVARTNIGLDRLGIVLEFQAIIKSQVEKVIAIQWGSLLLKSNRFFI